MNDARVFVAACIASVAWGCAEAHADSGGAAPAIASPHAELSLSRAPGAEEKVSPEGIEVAGWDLGATREESAPEAWGGARPSFGGDGQPLSQRVASYKLKAKLDPEKHTIEGSESLHWTNRSAVPIKSVYVHLYLNAFESAGSTFMTERAQYGAFRSGVETKKGEWGYSEITRATQGDKTVPWTFVHPDGGPASDHTVVRLDLPSAVPPGESTDIAMEFHDQLPRVVARTGYFDKFHLVAQWFPKIGVLELPGERGATAPRWNCHELHLHSEFYADFGTYEGDITAPDGYLVRATGRERGEPAKGDGGLVHHFAQDDVHDFVFTAWNGYAKPLAGSYDGPGSPHVEIEVLAPPEYADDAQIALKGTQDALGYFSKTLGPYPYEHLTVVVPPHNADEAGGMEYETFFTTIGGNGMVSAAVRYVTVHEFGHGYFMGLLATNEFEEPFLDEGMNETWDSRMLASEALTPKLPAPLRALGFSIPPIGYYDFESTGTRRFQADPIAGNSWDRFSSGSYGLVYQRTVMVFHDLESLLGTEAFAKGMKLYYARWHHRHPGTADLRAALAEGSGKPELVHYWFETQVYANEPIDDRVVSVDSEEMVPLPGYVVRDGKRVELEDETLKKEIEQAHSEWDKAHAGKGDKGGPYPFRNAVTVRRFAAEVPQTLVIELEDGTKETTPWHAGERWHRFVFERSSRVKSAQLDPERKYLLDIDKLDDGRTRESNGTVGMKGPLDVGAFLSLALALVVTQ
jgi:hypothetical protein